MWRFVSFLHRSIKFGKRNGSPPVIEIWQVRSINCNIHIQERIRLNLMEDFIKKYHLLKDKGFFVIASYVTYPPLIKRLARDYAFFKSRGIIIRPKLYRGSHVKFSILNHPRLRKLKNHFSESIPKFIRQRKRQ